MLRAAGGHEPAFPDFLAGGGEMGALMRAQDWAKTPLGPAAGWPQSLKTAVRIMLTSRQPIWIGWGKELIYLYNDPYKSIIGGKHPWALGRPTSEVWREIWDEIGPMLATAMSGGEGVYVEEKLLIMERNGYPEETYYTFSYSPIPNDDGTTGGIICANTDDTQRVIGERQLVLLRDLAARTAASHTVVDACSASAAALATAPRDLPFALIYLVDADKDRAVLCGISGIEGGHAAAPDEIALDERAIWPVGEAVRTNEVQIVGELGGFGALPAGAWEEPPTKAAVVPIGAQGQIGQAGVLIAGLNPFRLLDEGYHGFLNLVAGQIAGSLGNAQAYEAERRRAEALAEVDRAKTAFFSNVSHEFRTPLTLMLGPLEEALAKSRDRSSKTRDLIDVAHRNGVRLLKLVNTLLDFSRIEAGRVQATYEPVDLAHLAVDLASNFRAATDRAGLRLVVDAPRLPQPAYVDRDLIEKVVLNLLSNAFKFTFEGMIGVEVKASADGRAAELTVRDTGTGIPAHEVPRLFERFHRVEGAAGRTFEGSGIGLALVKELVELQGGTISVETEPGRGSAFTVSIPFGADHLPADRVAAGGAGATTAPKAQAYVDEALRWLPPDAEQAPAAPPPASDAAPPSASEPPMAPARAGSDLGRVLLADDNADMRAYVRRLLLERGYEVEAVADGEAALAAARRQAPDLVLSDVMMPKLDGFELLTAVKAEPALRHVPFILLSARAGEEARVEGMEAGADDYLTKPFSARELVARVDANLALARARSEAANALRARTAELEAVLNTVPAAVWFTHDRDASHAVGNSYAMKLLRVPEGDNASVTAPESERPQHFRVFRDGAEAAPETLGLQRAARGEEVRDEELEIRFDDGTSVIYLQHATPLRDPSGDVRGAVAAAIDITARKRAQEALHDARLNAAAAIEAARVGTWEYRPATREVIWDERLKALFGLSPDAVVDRDVRASAIHPDDRERLERALRDATDPGGDRKFAVDFRVAGAQSGGERTLTSSGRAFFKDGRCIRVIGVAWDVTEERRTREALADSEQQFRMLAESIPQLAWMADSKGWIFWYNQRWFDYTGTTLEEMQGWGWRAVHHPDHVERVVERISRHWESGEIWEDTFPLRGKDGAYRWFLSRARPIHDAAGRVVRWFGTNTDISEQREMEERLRQREAELARVQLIGEVGGVDVDLRDGFKNDRSPEYLRLHGLPPEAVNETHDDWVRRIHPDDRAQAERVFLDALAKGETEYAQEYRIIRPSDGAVRWISAKGEIERDAKGKPLRLVGAHIDVTDIKAIEEERERLVGELRQLNDTLERRVEEQARERARIFQLGHELFAVAGTDGYLKTINPAWTRLLGYDQDTLLTRPFADMIHPDDLEATAEAIASLKRGEMLARFEDRLRLADGSYRWFSWTAVPQGEVFYAVGRDVTDERAAIDAIAATNRELREQITERERVEETLAQMQRLEAVGQLTSGVAHDFNNLLTVVLGNIEFLERSLQGDARTTKRLAHMRLAAERGATLTSQLLAFSRRQRLEAKPTDLNETVESMSGLLRSTLGGSVAIETVLRPGLWPALVDPTQIELVILNLAINARDAMAVGGSLTIETGNVSLTDEPKRPEEPAPGEYVMVAVTDTGTGMSDEVLAKAFEPFFTTKEVGKGSGLGLAQVFGFAKQSRGGVAIDTVLGEGASVKVYLPRARAAAGAAEDRPSREAPHSRQRETLILVVDDDAGVREVTAGMVSDLGYRVVEAGDGPMALDVFKREPEVALLLLDFAMPGMNGAEVARRARAVRPDVPILFVTGFADAQALMAAGDERFVQKPFRASDLAAKIDASLLGASAPPMTAS